MTITPMHMRFGWTIFDAVLDRQNKATPPMLPWIEAFVRQLGRAPEFDEICAAANFRQPGGVGRLVEALHEYGPRLETAQIKAKAQ